MNRNIKTISFIPNYSTEGYLTVGRILKNDFADAGQEWDIFPHTDAQDEPGQYFLTRVPLAPGEPDNRPPLFLGYRMATVSGFINPRRTNGVYHAFLLSSLDNVMIETYDSIGGNRVHGDEQDPQLNFDTAITLVFYPVTEL